jgi:CRP/FNR family transcriptional regulator, cyclic AMP receptor protein
VESTLEQRINGALIPLSLAEHLTEGRSESFAKGSILCAEGQEPRGIFVLGAGRSKIYTTSADGRTIVLGIMNAGEMIGLTALLSGEPHSATVETLELSRATFITGKEFVRLMNDDPLIGIVAAQQLTKNCLLAVDKIRELGFSQTVPQKLARLLLRWIDSAVLCRMDTAGNTQLTVSSTQEEIAHIIGSTRESVSRALAGFRRMRILRIKGAVWTVLDQNALRKFVT